VVAQSNGSKGGAGAGRGAGAEGRGAGAAAGECAEKCAKDHGISREEMDEHCRESYARATGAMKHGWFDAEVVPVTVASKKESTVRPFQEIRHSVESEDIV
jgi:acetyl-CoA acetyltransferase